MDIQLIISVVGVVLTAIGGLWAVYTSLHKRMDDQETQVNLKIAAIHKSVEDHAENIRKTYVDRDQMKQLVDALRFTIDDLKQEFRNSISKVVDRIDDLMSKGR